MALQETGLGPQGAGFSGKVTINKGPTRVKASGKRTYQSPVKTSAGQILKSRGGRGKRVTKK